MAWIVVKFGSKCVHLYSAAIVWLGLTWSDRHRPDQTGSGQSPEDQRKQESHKGDADDSDTHSVEEKLILQQMPGAEREYEL